METIDAAPAALVHLADRGRLIDTGRTCIIHTAELPIYRCEACGEEFDPSDYEVIGAP